MVFVFACDLISLILIDYLSNELLTPRYDMKVKRILLIFGFIMMCLLNYNGASSIKALLILCLYSLYVFLMFEGSILYKCLCIIPYFTFQIIAEVFVGFVLSNVFHMAISKDMLSLSYIIGLVFSFVLLIFMTIVYVKMFKYIQGNELPWYTWFVFVVPIFTIFLLTSIEDYFLVFNTLQNDLFYIMVLLCSNVFLIVIFFLVFQSHKMAKELKMTYLKNESNKMRYQLLEQHHNIHFHLLHELLHFHTEIYQ